MTVSRRSSIIIADVVLAVGFTGLSIVDVVLAGESTVRRTVSIVLVVVMGVALGFRTSRPFPAYLVNGFALYAMTIVGVPGDIYPFGNAILLFAVAAHEPARRARVALGLAGVGVVMYFALLGGDDRLLAGAASALLWLVVWLAGRSVAARRRTEVVERERDRSTTLAATNEERLRLERARKDMARDIHDIVGHSINVMVVHASAGRLALPDGTDQVADALATIEQVGRKALGELDAVLGLLRDEDTSERRPLRGITDLPDLVEGVGRSGLEVELELDLRPEEVTSAVGSTVFRVVQEGLTNVLKHADARRVGVRVRRRSDRIDVEIIDDGGGPIRVSPASGSGLRGMRERVEVHGGTLEHGPGSSGGFELRASVPTGTTP